MLWHVRRVAYEQCPIVERCPVRPVALCEVNYVSTTGHRKNINKKQACLFSFWLGTEELRSVPMSVMRTTSPAS